MKFLAGCLLVISVSLLSGCTGGRTTEAYRVTTGGDADAGKQVIQSYGCGACHTIPGIRTARGVVGPPLYFLGRRTMIAGQVPNTPNNLVRWIRTPQEIEPGTAMPTLGLTDQQARDVAAYLYTLR